MTNSKLRQKTSEEIFKSLTPRQRCSVSHVIHIDDLSTPNPMHHRVNGNIQSILTFEVRELASLEGHGEDESSRSIDGWFGVWHGRVSAYPVLDLKQWDSLTTAKAEGIITRLLQRVGINEATEVHPGSDEKSVHVYKWSTHAELKIAKARLGGEFSGLMPKLKNGSPKVITPSAGRSG